MCSRFDRSPLSARNELANSEIKHDLLAEEQVRHCQFPSEYQRNFCTGNS